MQKKNTEEKPVKSEADKIWSEIKDKKIEMFALPNQVVSQYCKPINIEPSRAFVTISAASVLPALELALGEKYSLEPADKYIIISRAKK